jgi:hypothetical protein|tara:strand:- start:675 stop:902 length:228 start_codon:yes stop_codon:yes gene_type:complete
MAFGSPESSIDLEMSKRSDDDHVPALRGQVQYAEPQLKGGGNCPPVERGLILNKNVVQLEELLDVFGASVTGHGE